MALGDTGSNMTVLSMHDSWLNFYVYMSLDELYWGIRCGYVQRVTQTTQRFFLASYVPYPMLHLFLLLLGNGSERSGCGGLANYRSISPCPQAFQSRL